MSARVLLLRGAGADVHGSDGLPSDALHGLPSVTVEEVGAPAELFARLRESEWALTVIHLTHPQVDEPIVRRVAAMARAGGVVLAAPAVTFARTLLSERVGALGLIRAPITVDAIEPFLAEVGPEGPVVPLQGGGPETGVILVGESPAMADTFRTLARAAPTESTVLVTGESGTGKGVVARSIHEGSPRRAGPFVPVNCAAIPEALLESELFGHERGAFTGASARRRGRFERAGGGTLFLDEIGDMSLLLQAKLLRALEERTIQRVGSDEERAVDVRIVAATNQDLRAAIDADRFREDLYYRLSVVEIDLPPLRERTGDVTRLTHHFTRHFARKHGRPISAISERALEVLEGATWRGNVRELRNVIDRAVLMSRGEVLRATSLRMGEAVPRASARGEGETAHGYPPTTPLEAVEADHIRRVLDSVGGQIGRGADRLGIHRNTLTRKIRQYDLDGPDR